TIWYNVAPSKPALLRCFPVKFSGSDQGLGRRIDHTASLRACAAICCANSKGALAGGPRVRIPILPSGKSLRISIFAQPPYPVLYPGLSPIFVSRFAEGSPRHNV